MIVLLKKRFNILSFFLLAVFLPFNLAFASTSTFADDSHMQLSTFSPIQVLEGSKSSFNLRGGTSEQTYYTLLNTSYTDKVIDIHLIESDGFDSPLTTEPLTSYFGFDFKYPSSLTVPARSVVRVPFTFEAADEGLVQSSFSGLVQFRELEVNQPSNLSMGVVVPIKISSIRSSIEEYIPSKNQNPYPFLSLIILLFSIPLFFIFFHSKIQSNHPYAAFILFVSFIAASLYHFALIDSGSYIMSNNVLDANLEASATDDVESEAESSHQVESLNEVLDSYEYEELSEDFVTLNIVEVDDIQLSSVYETEVDFGVEVNLQTQATQENELFIHVFSPTSDLDLSATTDSNISASSDVELASTPNVDVSSADELGSFTTPDVDYISQPVVDYESPATEEIVVIELDSVRKNDINTEVEIFELPGTSLVDTEVGLSYEAIYNNFTGVEVKITKTQNPFYNGLKVSFNSLSRSLSLNPTLADYYFDTVMSLKDGGVKRIQVRKFCAIATDDELSNREAILLSLLLKMFTQDEASVSALESFSRDIFKKENRRTLSHIATLCSEFDEANNYSVELLKRQNLLSGNLYFNNENKELTWNEPNIESDPVLNEIIKNEKPLVAKKDLEDDTQLSEEEIVLTSFEDAKPKEETLNKKQNAEELTLYDLIDNEIEEVLDTEIEVDENLDDTELIEDEEILLDLEDSKTIEVTIPTAVTFPVLSRQTEPYYATSQLGTFNVTTYSEGGEWVGFLTITSILDAEGLEIDDMSIQVNDVIIYPEKAPFGEKSTLFFKLDNSLFEPDKKGPKNIESKSYTFNPVLTIKVPGRFAPGNYSSDIALTFIQ